MNWIEHNANTIFYGHFAAFYQAGMQGPGDGGEVEHGPKFKNFQSEEHL